MKTSVEINGYVISIEETDGVISVNATKDEEVVEEFTIEIEEGDNDSEGSDDDVRSFGDYDEEDDFEGEDDDEFEGGQEEMEDDLEGSEDDDEDEDEEREENETPALESFQSFINKKRK
jgi:hypothetical protein